MINVALSFRSHRVITLILVGALFAAIPSFRNASAQCNPYVVTLNTDSAPPNCGELRYAIKAATVGQSTVTITFNLTGSNTITLINGELAINGTNTNLITIDGRTSDVIIDGNQNGRIFNIASGRNVSLQHLTMHNGKITSDFGGGIYNNGTLTIGVSTLSNNWAQLGGGLFNANTANINDSVISDNLSDDNGGGIINIANMKIENSTISRNRALSQGYGGGLYNEVRGTLTVFDSTISDNNAQQSGGAVSNGGTLMISSSTLSDNSSEEATGGVENGGILLLTNSLLVGNSGRAGGMQNRRIATIIESTFYNNRGANGGGIFNDGNATLTIGNSTIYGNQAMYNGGIVNYSYDKTDKTALYVFSTIIAGNTTEGGNNSDVSGSAISLGCNLIGDGSGSSGLMNGISHDQVGTDNVPIDPKFVPLADNGGLTQTLAIQATTSPAYQMGNCDGYSAGGIMIPLVETDQRGYSRKALCDVGAFEYSGQPQIPPTIPAAQPAF